MLRLAAAVFIAAAVAALRLAKPALPPPIDRADEKAALRVPTVMLGASAMGLLRGIVGFLTFLVAFALRAGHQKSPSWWFGLILAVSLGATFVGAVVAPRLRQWVVEERILMGSLLLVGAVAIVASRYGNRPAVAAVAAAVGFAASAGKLAFDSIVQRDAPDAARGRNFARYETRFQLMWVAGGLVPVVVTPLPRHLEWGMVVIAAAAAFAVFSYAGGRVAARRHG